MNSPMAFLLVLSALPAAAQNRSALPRVLTEIAVPAGTAPAPATLPALNAAVMAPAPLAAPAAALASLAAPSAPARPNPASPSAPANAPAPAAAQSLNRLAAGVPAASGPRGSAAAESAAWSRAIDGSAVAFEEGVPADLRAALTDSLNRRKTGWSRGLLGRGLAADGPVPTLSAREARPRRDAVDYTLDWTQGDLRAGAVTVRVRRSDLTPTRFESAFARPAPASRQMLVRFLDSAAPGEIESLLSAHRLRPVTRLSAGEMRVVVLDEAKTPASVSAAIAAAPVVLYSRPMEFAAPASRRLTVFLKTGAPQDRVAALLRRHGLKVIGAKDLVWELAASRSGDNGARAAERLSRSRIVRYAAAESFEPAESRQAMIRLRAPGDEKAVAALLRRHKLTFAAGGGDALRVAFPPGARARGLARLAADPLVASAAAVGSLADAKVQASAESTRRYKSKSYAASEYNLQVFLARFQIEMDGATQEQLALFDRLCAAIPNPDGFFSSRSGD